MALIALANADPAQKSGFRIGVSPQSDTPELVTLRQIQDDLVVLADRDGSGRWESDLFDDHSLPPDRAAAGCRFAWHVGGYGGFFVRCDLPAIGDGARSRWAYRRRTGRDPHQDDTVTIRGPWLWLFPVATVGARHAGEGFRIPDPCRLMERVVVAAWVSRDEARRTLAAVVRIPPSNDPQDERFLPWANELSGLHFVD